MKCLFVCFVLFNLCACQSKGVQKVVQKSDMVAKTIPAVLDSQCRINTSFEKMSQDQKLHLHNMQFEFEKSGIESVECLSAKALETEEQKKKAYEEVVKVNSQTTVKKVGLVESLTGETVSDELSLDDGKLNKCFSEEKNFPYDLARL